MIQNSTSNWPLQSSFAFWVILFSFIGCSEALNYDMFGFDNSSPDFKMDPALIWDEGSNIACMDISPTGELVIGGRNPEMFVSKTINLVYTESATDFSANRINETNTWALGHSYNVNDTWFSGCVFTPQVITGLSHRYIIAEYTRTTTSRLRAFMVIDPKASNANGFEVKYHLFSDHITTQVTYEDYENTEKFNDVIGILQETNIITLYRSTIYYQYFYISKFIINTATWDVVQDPSRRYTIQESITTITKYRRSTAFFQSGYHFYFALTHKYTTSSQWTIFGRFTECTGCADVLNMNMFSTAYTSTSGGIRLYNENLGYPSANSNVLKTIEVMAYYSRLIGMGSVRQVTSDGSVTNVNFGILRYVTWCPSRAERMDIMLPDNEQVNPMALHAPSVEDSYMFGVVNSATDGKKLKIFKLNYPQDASCTKSVGSFTPTAKVIDLELDLFKPADIEQIVLAQFDSSYSALFIGGKVLTMQNSAAVNRGFLDGVSLGYIDSLTPTDATCGTVYSWSQGSVWTTTSTVYTRPDTVYTYEPEKHPCVRSISLNESSWATSGHVLTIYNQTNNLTFFPEEIFQSKFPDQCLYETCTTWTYTDQTLLYDTTTFDNTKATAAHASNISWVADPATSKLQAQIDIALPSYDYKVSFKCGNSYSTIHSNVFSINVTDPCKTIEIAAVAGFTPSEISAPQRVFVTADEVRHDPDDEQTIVTLPLDMFPDPSSWCDIKGYSISKVYESDGTTEIAQAVWSPILTLEEAADGSVSLKIIPPVAATLLPFEIAKVYVTAHLTSQSKEFFLATIDLTASIEINAAPILQEDLEELVLEFEYYPMGPEPLTKSEPEEDETMEIIPPRKNTYKPVIYELPTAIDSNNFDYVAGIAADIPLTVRDVVTFDSKTNTTEFSISTFSFSQAKLTEFEVIYTLVDRWGAEASSTQKVTLEVTLVYETRTFTKKKKQEEPVEEEPEEEEIEEEQEEVVEEPSGYVFPGFVISEEEVAAWAGEEAAPSPVGEEKKFVPLRASISDITTLGQFTVQFNQAIRNDLFELENLGEALFFEIVPGDYEKSPYFDIANLGFVWEAIKLDEAKNQLLFQVNFTNAMYISAETIQDEMAIRITNPDLFKSMEFDSRISYGSKTMWSPVKKQMPNNEASQSFDQSTTTTEESMSSFTIFSFVLNLLFKGALKEITSTILSLQIIINLFLLTVPFPANSSNLVSKIKPLVSFDILKSFTSFTLDLFPRDVDQQAEYRGEILTSVQNMGTKSHNAMPNLGNMGHLLCFYFVLLVFLAYYKFRGIGSLEWGIRHTEFKKKLCFGQLFSILISGFLPITIAVYFQLKRPLFTTSGEKLGFCFGLFFFVLEHLFFPAVLVWILTVPREVLDQPEFKDKWGRLYTKARYDTLPRRAYLHIYILRRLVLLAIGLYIYARPPLQILLVNVMNVAVIIYTGLSEPQITRHDRRMEIFNEGMVAVITYNLFMFTDALPDQGAQYIIGWVFVSSFFIMLVFNSYFVVKNTFKRTKLLLAKHLKKRSLRKKLIQDKSSSLSQKALKEIPVGLPADERSEPDYSLYQLPTRGKRKLKKKQLVSIAAPVDLSVINEEHYELTEMSAEALEIYYSLKTHPKTKPAKKGKKKQQQRAEESLNIFTNIMDDLDDLGDEGTATSPSKKASPRSTRSEKRFSITNVRRAQHREPSEFEEYLSRRLSKRRMNYG